MYCENNNESRCRSSYIYFGAITSYNFYFRIKFDRRAPQVPFYSVDVFGIGENQRFYDGFVWIFV